MEDEKSEDSAIGDPEEPVLEAALTAGTPDSKRPASMLSKAVGIVGVLAVALSVLFGVLWGASSADLRDSQSSLADEAALLAAAETKLADTKSRLADIKGELTDAKSELVDAKLATFILQRGGEYTACLSYYGGYYSGSGISTTTSVTLAKASCASESAWNIEIQPAP
jgi:hypothetical protein